MKGPGPETETSTDLDEAFERMASAGFELPNGFVNHGAMACEALDALGFDGELGEWAKRFACLPGPAVTPKPGASLDWRESLGNYSALPEWIGYFEAAIGEDGWPEVVEVWVPRLVPALATVLFHGVIRVGHAVRAINAADTSPRREELARALGYWAARYRPGQVVSRVDEEDGAGAVDGVDELDGAREVDDVQQAVVAAAADAARYYLASPSIPFLHGVTGAMAIELLAPHLSGPDQAAALARLGAEHRALYAGARPVAEVRVGGASRQQLATAAENSGDPHEVKLVEAALRAFDLSGDPVFAAASETVTGLMSKGAA
jgi:Questin oxidase-like